jgi:hypothetical protein
LRITLQVTDVFAVAIKEREAFQQQQKCGGAKYRRGRSPNGVLWNPNRPNRAVSSYRLLGEGCALHYFPYFIIHNYLL